MNTNRRIRLYIEKDIKVGDCCELSQEQSHYLCNVMRCKEGDFIHCFNERCGEFLSKIIKIDNELKRISLSLKRMGENPWQQIEGQFEEGQVVKGTVNKVTTFGAFINIFPGVEALLPVAEMSDENVNPFNLFKVGAEVDVLIKKFTPKEHRIALSIKDINA